MRKSFFLLVYLILLANIVQATVIYIQSPDGRIIRLEQPASNSIEQLMHYIQSTTNFPVQHQLIAFNKKILAKGLTLEDNAITDNSYLQLIITANPSPTTQNILYVNQHAPTSSDQSGNSWNNAITDLSSALLWVRQQEDAGTASWTSKNPLKIYIAQGTYYPVYNANDNQYNEPGMQQSAFVLTKNVQLLGGFPSTGNPDINARDWTKFTTTLSGDPLTPTNDADNRGHVVITVDTNDSTMLSGLIITAGRSYNSTIPVGGYYIDPYVGAGMVCMQAAPTLENVVFQDNQVVGANGPLPGAPIGGINGMGGYPAYGGGMYNENSSPMLINVSFKSNQAIGGAGSDGLIGENGDPGSDGGNGGPGGDALGGALYNSSSSPTLINVVFYDNMSNGGKGGKGGNGGTGSSGSGGDGGNGGNGGLASGAGIYSYGSGSGTVNIINCSFSKNKAASSNGGEAGSGGNAGPGSTGQSGFDGNNGAKGQSYGAAIVDYSGGNIENSIIFDNTADVSPEVVGVSSTNFTYSYIKGSGAWQAEFGTDGGQNIISTANPFTDNQAGDLTLVATSQAIDNGNNASFPTFVSFDQLNHPRINNTTIDMGAYEFGNYTVPVALVYFKAARMNHKIHLSWATASESGNANFIIAKSVNGINYQKLAVIEARGNSSRTSEYSWDDPQPENGTNYYQLKQVDVNGHIKNLGVRTVNFSKNEQVRLYPNPAKDQVHLILDINSTVRIYDPAGKKVLEFKGHAGDNLLEISNLSNGIYFIELDKSKNRIKLLKQ